MANFQTFADVDKWVAEHSVDELRDLIASPMRTHPENRRIGHEWLQGQQEAGNLAREDESHEFMRRQTIAAEISARAAEVSARWAMLGGFTAVAALVATAWPYMKLLETIDRLAR
ncbi:hypothetical protein [Rhizobacter sp. SG703]|uniref:hypothetical protein n=1 Tax=Rhizobacter sp. SG703 TaxID=2587140 RepID=UPI0014476D6B|nr:hypothetical protein [Rhizobacter sp. SG703]NKI96639.1 hypothetical protein [Rhizobacter sp. SG703]